MIRYPISERGTAGADLAELKRRVTGVRPSWLNRAAKRTNMIVQAGIYNESSGIWREIKVVYRKLQHSKCAFCERLVHEGGGELEHFRPKSEVRAWPQENDTTTARHLAHLPDLATGDPLEAGYYKLAYALLNYSLACHYCNAILKKCFFPIAGSRKIRAAKDPVKYLVERPLLIFPIGSLDEDPETLIHFRGIFPFPVEEDTATHAHRRALVSILFFKLFVDSTLLLERALVIMQLYKALEGCGSDDAKTVDLMTSGRLAYTNCCRSFVRVHSQDKIGARGLYKMACRFIETKGYC